MKLYSRIFERYFYFARDNYTTIKKFTWICENIVSLRDGPYCSGFIMLIAPKASIVLMAAVSYFFHIFMVSVVSPFVSYSLPYQIFSEFFCLLVSWRNSVGNCGIRTLSTFSVIKLSVKMDDILGDDTHYDGVKQQLIILCILIRAFVPTASVEYITSNRPAETVYCDNNGPIMNSPKATFPLVRLS